MLALLLLGTLFYAVLDYGLVTSSVSYNKDPTRPAELARFKSGAVVQTGPNSYSVYMTAHLWAWTPGVVHVKQGPGNFWKGLIAGLVCTYSEIGECFGLHARSRLR